MGPDKPAGEGAMQVGLLADTHGYLDPRVAEIMAACALIVHAGDIGSDAVLAALEASATCIAVAGNNDTARDWPEGEQDRLAALPASASLELPGGRLVVVHGHRLPARGRHRRLRAQYPDAAAIVLGHSHRRVIAREATPWLLNPGAAGRNRAYGGPGCLVLHANDQAWCVEARTFEPRPKRHRR
jgi:putative phosphoesterase